ncbi:hypothetical protein F5144DRAFT_620316 [Chaetomium tenue]|uniref:Uncharacterized protein n=1 Tax=Chaetomium tenue TaxID=1854479 RepID=A0ACB7PDX9_9PEZI|nr:hypothetical protein F5144DRAFT_620316 [Chaetomium globosum]
MDQIPRHLLHDMSSEKITAYMAKYPYNGQLFSVLISDRAPEPYQPHSNSIEGAWVDVLEDASYHDGKDPQKTLQQLRMENEVERKMLEVVFPTLQELAPAPTIEEYLFPNCVKLELVTKDGKLEIIPGHHIDVERARYVIPWSEMEKAGFQPGDPEVEIYGKLKGLELGPEIRIPEFKVAAADDAWVSIGLITSGNGVVGFIMAKIPAKHPSLFPIVTNNFPGERPAMALRQQWAAQMEHTVATLHEHGIVWGNAKPDHLLVDLEDNLWLLGFGGQLTLEGWMDPSLMETKEGDLAAVAKMKEGLLDERANGGNKAGTK